MENKKEIFLEKDFMAFIKSDKEDKGAWVEEGKTEWTEFKSKEGSSPVKPEISKNDKKIKIFFVEDNKTVQIAIKTFISSYHEMEFTGYASNGIEAVNKIKEMTVPPDVILMDIAMPQMNGIDATREILKINPSVKIIMLTAYGTKQYIVDAFAAGAIGYIRKDGGLKLIKEAINQAARGGVVPLQDEIAVHLLEGVDTAFMEEDDDEIEILDSDEEEIEMTEEEFIEQLTLEILEEILSAEHQDYPSYIKQLLEGNNLKETAEKFINQFDDDTFPEDITREFLTEEIVKKLEIALLKHSNSVRKHDG